MSDDRFVPTRAQKMMAFSFFLTTKAMFTPISLLFLLSTISYITLIEADPIPQSGAVQNGALARAAQVLTAFRKTVNKDPFHSLASWTGGAENVCNWKGITCGTPPGSKSSTDAFVDLANFELGGANGIHLQGLLDALPDLDTFTARAAGFSGSIPDISKLRYIEELTLRQNSLSGGFPRGALVDQLIVLDIRENHFSGPLPADLFSKRDLEKVFASENAFNGPIPEVGGVTKVTSITLANNRLTGPIPRSLARLKGMDFLDLGGNQLTGTIPEEICALPNMNFMELHGNRLDTKNIGPKCTALIKKGVLRV